MANGNNFFSVQPFISGKSLDFGFKYEANPAFIRDPAFI